MSGPAYGYDYIAKIICLGDSGVGKSSLTIRLCEGRFTNTHDVTIGVEFGSRIMPVGPPASLTLGINNPTSNQPVKINELEPTSPPDSKPSRMNKPSKSKPSLAEPPRSKPSQKHMKLALWDTAGQEVGADYPDYPDYPDTGASGALLVFDITRRNTFESVTQWLHDLRQIADEDIVVVLVGNKSDLADASLVGGDVLNKRAVTEQEAREWCKRNSVHTYLEASAKNGEMVERAFLELAERIYQNIEAGKYDLNDRRSGVKGPGAGANARNGRNRAGGEVVLGVNKVGGMNKDEKAGWSGGCC